MVVVKTLFIKRNVVNYGHPVHSARRMGGSSIICHLQLTKIIINHRSYVYNQVFRTSTREQMQQEKVDEEKLTK